MAKKMSEKAKHEARRTMGAMNAETNDETAGDTSVMRCSCCGNEVEPLGERVRVPLIEEEAEELHELVNALEAGELGDRARFLFEASCSLNLPEIGKLIAGLMVRTFAAHSATAENAA